MNNAGQKSAVERRKRNRLSLLRLPGAWHLSVKLRRRCKTSWITILAEHAHSFAIDSGLDLSDKNEVRAFAVRKLRGYGRNPPASFLPTAQDRLFFPMHAMLPQMYLLQMWRRTREMGINRILRVAPESALQVHSRLRALGFNWTHTTALALEPAIQLAEEGKNVVAMVYGTGQWY